MSAGDATRAKNPLRPSKIGAGPVRPRRASSAAKIALRPASASASPFQSELTCVRVCPYEVPVINLKGEAEIDLAKCKGCGCCAAECPARAIELMHFRDPQLWEKAKALVIGAA